MRSKLYILMMVILMIGLTTAFNWSDGTLVSYYDFNEGSGTIVEDKQGQDHNGTTINSPEWVGGILGSALNFSQDAQQFVNVTNAVGLGYSGTDNYSVSAWIYPNSSTGQFWIANKLGSWLVRQIGLKIWITHVDDIDGADHNSFRTTNDVINVGQWQHVAYSYNGTGGASAATAVIYINGTSVPVTTVYSHGNWANDAGNFMIGNGTGPTYNGGIDELGVWNRTFVPLDFTQLYNSGAGLAFGDNPSLMVVNLITPANGTEDSGDITFNAQITPADTFNLTNATTRIWLSNGTLFTTGFENLTGDVLNTSNFTVSNFTVGDYIWNVEGCAENATMTTCTSDTENFTFSFLPFSVNSQNFTAFTRETDLETFIINITTLSNILSVDAKFNYNGTLYDATANCVGSVCEITSSFDIPLLPGASNLNRTSFWEITVFDGTTSLVVNTTANTINQQITPINVDICGGGLTDQALNFTAFRELNNTLIDKFDFDGTFSFWFGSGTVKRQSSVTQSDVFSVAICVEAATDRYIDADIDYNEFNTTTFTARTHFFQNDTINGTLVDIPLGLLDAAESTSFILKVQDDNLLPLIDRLIVIEKFYAGINEFKTVQIARTADNGKTVGFLQAETATYRFTIKYNGEELLITNPGKVVGEDVPFTLTFTVGVDEGAPWQDLEPLDELEHTLSYNATTNIVTYTYIDSSGNFTSARLLVQRQNVSGSLQSLVCNETSVLSSATITCNVGSTNGTYVATGYITRDNGEEIVEIINFNISTIASVLGLLGVFLGWFIILISAFAFKFNEIAGIFMINASIIFVNLIGLVNFGLLAVSAIIACSIIIVAVLER